MYIFISKYLGEFYKEVKHRRILPPREVLFLQYDIIDKQPFFFFWFLIFKINNTATRFI